MMSGKQINYKFHLPIIVALLIVQFFIVDIYSSFHLNHIYQKQSELNSFKTSLYQKGEYTPLIIREIPNDYKFVLVKQNGNNTEEIYFTPKGRKVTVKLANGKWYSTSSDEGAINIFLFLPLCGFLLILFTVLKSSIREKTIFAWSFNWHSYEKLEKICLIYGIPLFVSAIAYGFIGRGP